MTQFALPMTASHRVHSGVFSQDVTTCLAVYAELCGAFRSWAEIGKVPQHGPDWRVTDGRRV